jgi:hypothetical protein
MAESTEQFDIYQVNRLVKKHHEDFMQEYCLQQVSSFISGEVPCYLDETDFKNLNTAHQLLILSKNAYIVVVLSFYEKIHESQQKELVDDPVNAINSAYECILPEGLQRYRAQIKAVAIKQPQSILL